jgi:hypothetical protein
MMIDNPIAIGMNEENAASLSLPVNTYLTLWWLKTSNSGAIDHLHTFKPPKAETPLSKPLINILSLARETASNEAANDLELLRGACMCLKIVETRYPGSNNHPRHEKSIRLGKYMRRIDFCVPHLTQPHTPQVFACQMQLVLYIVRLNGIG